MASSSSSSRALTILATIFGTIWTGFGVNALVRPLEAYHSIFEFPVPSTPADRKTIEALMAIYGARDLFMGFAVFVTALLGGGGGGGRRRDSRTACGWILIAGAAVAGVDGVASINAIGAGHWNHWAYAPAVAAVGALLAAGY